MSTDTAQQQKADCYSAGDRAMMEWSQTWRARLLGPLLRAMAALRINADHLTALSLLTGLAFCPVYFYSKPLALLLLALHVAIDGLDGPLARHLGRDGRAGSFTDSLSDQIVVTASTITLMADHVIGLVPGCVYVFTYAIVVVFAMVRNAMHVPYSWLVRPRFFVYLWFIVELYVWPNTIDWLLWGFIALLTAKMLSGFVRIRTQLKPARQDEAGLASTREDVEPTSD